MAILTERGRWSSSTLDERGKRVFTVVTEQGRRVFGVSTGSSVSGAAALSGAGSLVASGTVSISGTSALSGNGSLTVTGTLTISGGASLTGTGSLTAAGTATDSLSPMGGADLSGIGSMTVTGSLAIQGGAILSGNGSLVANGAARLPTYKKVTLEAERITKIQLVAEVRWQIPLQAERVVAIQLQAGGGNLTKENQNVDMYAGDGLDLLFPLPSKKDDLSTASITWTLKDRLGGTVLLTKTVGSGITVDGSSFTVRLDGLDTSGLAGRFFYVGKITKDGVTSTSVTGHIKIETT